MSNYHTLKSSIKDVTLAVKNLEQSELFYQHVIHLETILKDDTSIILGSNNIPLIKLVQVESTYIFQEGLFHIALLLKDETQMANWLHENKEFIQYFGASHHGVSKAIYLQDPDQNGIEIYIDTNDSTWKRNNHQIEMYTMPLDVDEVLTHKTNSRQFDFVIGHVHLKTRDVMIMARFYELLGFQSTFDLHSAIFMSYNGYHHHIAFNEWNKNQMQSHEPNRPGIKDIHIWLENEEYFDLVKKNLQFEDITYAQQGDTITLVDPLQINIKITYKGETL